MKAGTTSTTELFVAKISKISQEIKGDLDKLTFPDPKTRPKEIEDKLQSQLDKIRHAYDVVLAEMENVMDDPAALDGPQGAMRVRNLTAKISDLFRRVEHFGSGKYLLDWEKQKGHKENDKYIAKMKKMAEELASEPQMIALRNYGVKCGEIFSSLEFQNIAKEMAPYIQDKQERFKKKHPVSKDDDLESGKIKHYSPLYRKDEHQQVQEQSLKEVSENVKGLKEKLGVSKEKWKARFSKTDKVFPILLVISTILIVTLPLLFIFAAKGIKQRDQVKKKEEKGSQVSAIQDKIDSLNDRLSHLDPGLPGKARVGLSKKQLETKWVELKNDIGEVRKAIGGDIDHRHGGRKAKQ